MGKQEQCKVDGPKTYVLKFDMHCKCNGCIKKINGGIKEISLSEGVESTDLLVERGEVKVSGRMDPEKLCSLLHAVTKKCVQIVAQATLSEGHTTTSQQNKDLHGQVPSDWFAPAAREPSSWWRDDQSTFPITPSAPPLPEDEAWIETVPSERCWYRWPAPNSSISAWAASDITGTLAMYEL